MFDLNIPDKEYQLQAFQFLVRISHLLFGLRYQVLTLGFNVLQSSCVTIGLITKVHIISYFSAIISEVRVEGLETLDYLDNLCHKERFTEQGDALTFESEVCPDKSYDSLFRAV